MPSVRGFPLHLHVVVALMLLGGSPASAQKAMPDNAKTIMPENKVPGQVESTARRLMNRLDQQGYEVLRGYFKLYTKQDCDMSYSVMHTCYGNNPAAPYVVPVVPSWPDHPGPGEWVDSATTGALGNTVAGYNPSYRLDPHEALVILAQMPPPAAFFGLKTYLFTRDGVLCDGSNQYSFVKTYLPAMFPTFFSLVPKEPESTPRVQILADLSNSPNNVIIRNQSGAVWDQLRYFVVTPNPKMDAAVRDALMKIGIARQDIFTEKVPAYFPPVSDPPACPDASAVRFGVGQQADDFITLLRYVMPVDEAAANSWRERLPMVVLRIRNVGAEVQTYPWENLEQREPSTPPETSYSSDLDTLAQSVCGMWNSGGIQNCTQWKKLINMQVAPLYMTGSQCVPAWMNCLAPSEDATYQMSARLPLKPDQFYAVVGPLSTATDNASYVGLGLNSSLKQLGFDNIFNDKLAGSATGYASGIPSEKFYVQYFARDCKVLDGQLPPGVTFNCYPVGDAVPYCYDSSDRSCDMLVLSLRGYIRPGTQRASDQNSVLNSRYILLNIPKP